ncbi:MAG: SAM-dependent methyltransferase [Propionibacterium sp.]|nr:MAG: SAM-dependent methyltransferase [Propionibacterium sp.]
MSDSKSSNETGVPSELPHADHDSTTETTGPKSSPEYRAPGHWLLAKMGKRVLRPGGLGLTKQLLAALAVGAEDRVVELGPGIGRTAELLLAEPYRSYRAVEANEQASQDLVDLLAKHHDTAVAHGDARETGLPSESADVVVSEAMLTMQSAADKEKIAQEAWRVLAPGGRWGIHELSFRPDDLDPQISNEVAKELSRTIKVGARPLTEKDWLAMFTAIGFEVQWVGQADMRLIEPSRVIADEGFSGALRFFNNVRRNPEARKRILRMRKVFRTHRRNLAAIGAVLVKPLAD